MAAHEVASAHYAHERKRRTREVAAEEADAYASIGGDPQDEFRRYHDAE